MKPLLTWLIALLPILAGYSLLGIPLIYPVQALLIGSALFDLLGHRKLRLPVKAVHAPLWLTMILLACSLLTVLVTGASLFPILKRTTLLMLWSLTIWSVSQLKINIRILKKAIIRIATVCCLYLFLQYISWYIMGSNLPSHPSFGALKALRESNEEFNRLFYFRPSSLFSESAYFAYYLAPAIGAELFELQNHYLHNKKTLWASVSFLSLGIVLSTSSSGVVFLVILFLYDLKQNYSLSLKKISRGFCILMVGTVLLLPFLHNEKVSYALYNTVHKLFNMGGSGRIGLNYALLKQLTGAEWWLGRGIGNEGFDNTFLNSIVLVLFSCGIIGLVACVIYMLFLYSHTKGNSFGRALVLLYGVSLLAESSLYATFFILYPILIGLDSELTYCKSTAVAGRITI